MKQGSPTPWVIALSVVVMIRLLSLGEYPLTDNTEARYGEIARVMVTSGNWLMPQLEDGIPFRAKPPLSVWQNAASMSAFGVSEFAVRIPALLNMLLVLLLLNLLARRSTNSQVGWMSGFITMTTVLGFIAAGAVMTDPAMLLATTLAMVSFWLAVNGGNKRWGYIFFIALSMGLLAKGPVAWVITGMPLAVWLTLQRQWHRVPHAIPLAGGTMILGLTALPWFVLAEFESPGYLQYFFIGEHVYRYLDSGWTGDQYGTAHNEPRGTIWLFGIATFAPWSVLALIIVIVKCVNIRAVNLSKQPDSLKVYLLLWCLCPLVFFTLAGNILPTYVLPGLPAFALLLAMTLRNTRFTWPLIGMGMVLPATVCMAGPLGLHDQLHRKSQAATIATLRELHPDTPIIYVGRIPHSARFYSQGSVESLALATAGTDQPAIHRATLLVVRNGRSAPDYLRDHSLTMVMKQSKYTTYLYTPDPVTAD